MIFRNVCMIAGLVALLMGCAIDKEMVQQRAAEDQHKPSAVLTPFSGKSPALVKKVAYRPYRLGVEDVIQINVLNRSSLDVVQAVRPDGKISFYPTGDLQAAGLTPEELRQNIVERLKNESTRPYTLNVDDVVSISVFDHDELNVTQAIRPDGKISALIAGEVQAKGLKIEELRARLEQRFATQIKNPIVNVVIQEYNSKPLNITDPIVNVVVKEYNSQKVAIVGSVAKPGILKMRSDVTLVEAISQVGGLNPDADLKRCMLFRKQELLPVNFEKLFRHGDITQNVVLEPYDAIFVASSRDNKAYVIGEVRTPGAVTWEGTLSLLESIPLAGGYTKNAQNQNVLVIRGGLVDPKLILVDAEAITKEGMLENNIALQPGDIVYVPKTVMASVERYLTFASNILQPILALESSAILGNTVKQILSGEPIGVGTSINLNP